METEPTALSDDEAIFRFVFYEESNSIGVFDIEGFLGSVLTPQTLWTTIVDECKGGRGFIRLRLQGNVPAEAPPSGSPDWAFIEERFKELDEALAHRREIKADIKNKLTLEELGLDNEEAWLDKET